MKNVYAAPNLQWNPSVHGWYSTYFTKHADDKLWECCGGAQNLFTNHVYGTLKFEHTFSLCGDMLSQFTIDDTEVYAIQNFEYTLTMQWW